MPILVAYGEIALKSPYVRSSLEKRLASQIEQVLNLRGFAEARATRRFGRIIVEGVPHEAANIIADVFGVVTVIPSEATSSKIDDIIELSIKVAGGPLKNGSTFAVRSKVVGQHTYGSMDLAAKMGSAIMEAYKELGIKVNLTQPDVTVGIEVRDNDSYVFIETFEGVGGLPYGSQGRAISLFSGGIDSPVATWLLMKRGVSVYPLFMDQTPYVGESYLLRAKMAFKAISRYIPYEDAKIYSAPMGPVMKRILDSSEPRFTCVLCKRAMYRIGEAFCKTKNAKGLVTGESLGQVASQTLDNLFVLDAAIKMPILRPLIGMDKVEIEDLARRIGTYSVTAHRVEGCKAVPEVPATTSQIDKIESIEAQLSLETMCEEVVRGISALTWTN